MQTLIEEKYLLNTRHTFSLMFPRACVFAGANALSMQQTRKTSALITIFCCSSQFPFSLRSFTNSNWEAEILPEPSTRTITQHIGKQTHVGEKTAEPCVSHLGAEGEGSVSVPKLVKS